MLSPSKIFFNDFNFYLGFYHAWFDDEWGTPGWLMTDILYGQVWAYSLGLGDLLDVSKMQKHLKKEVTRNDSPYGLMVGFYLQCVRNKTEQFE